MRRILFVSLAVSALTTACGDDGSPSANASGGATSTGGEAGTGGSPASGGAGVGGGQGSCKEPATSPVLTVSGSACGTSISFSAPEGSTIHLARTSATQALGEVWSITVQDAPSAEPISLPTYFEANDVLLNVTFAEGIPLQVGSTPVDTDSGALWACPVGSVGFASGQSVNVNFASLDGGTSGGTMAATIDLPVAAFSDSYGIMDIPACSGGTVTVSLQGSFVYEQ